MDTNIQTLMTDLRRKLESLYEQRLANLVLYGSYAREDAEPGSDIDLLVVLEGPVDPGEEIARTGKIVAELCLAHGVVISCVFMDRERFLHRQGPFLRNIRREGVPV